VRNRAGIRRSPFLVTYWENGAHVAYNYLTRASRPCSPLVVAILDATSHWTSRESVQHAVSRWQGGIVEQTIDELIRDDLLHSADRPTRQTEDALASWDGWNPVAGFFHAATQLSSLGDGEGVGEEPAPFLALREFPPTLKRYLDRPRVELPACSGTGQLAEVLRSRRTWREFGDRHLTLDEAATLLGLTFGVERWLEVSDDRWVALKSSPSGGARHSIEAYLLSFGVEGIENGTYHYCPDSHALTLLGSPTSRELLNAFMPAQAWVHKPAAFVVMTSVFARVQHKYQHPHAYRVVLLDAGHLSQTFLLVATALGLAPFCVAAFDSLMIERHLGIDGVSESVVLAVGVGPKPQSRDWAPTDEHSENPRTAPPAWAARLPAPPFPPLPTFPTFP
jgi:SagB-type dehydrogenase family enzyme